MFSVPRPRVIGGLSCALGLALVGACGSGDGDSESSGDLSSTGIFIDSETDAPEPICSPGAISCQDSKTAQVCVGAFKGWSPIPCGDRESCVVDQCIGPCDVAEETPSSEGCSFIAARMTHFYPSRNDAIVVGNTDKTESANIMLWHAPDFVRKELLLEGPLTLAPGEIKIFNMDDAFVAGFNSGFRTGGIYRVESDFPIVAYQHSPLENSAGNDSSMLLPEHTLAQDYIVYSYPGFENTEDPPPDPEPHGRPSYFSVIALDYDTTVTWVSKVDTDGDDFPVPYVKAGEEGRMVLNRYDILQVAASDNEPDRGKRDVSGTVVHADKPVWVVGATRCAFVPFKNGYGYCDHLQEQMIPIERWGKAYVGAHSPTRYQEKHFWRVFAGEDNVTVWTEPKTDGTPFTLDKMGDYREPVFDTGVSVVFRGSGPIMPVQYLAGSREDTNNIGDPSMYAMVPVEQFLERYAFSTGVDYAINYVQVVRSQGGAEVRVDGVPVTGYYPVGDLYEVSDWQIDEGTHIAESDDPFGITNVGYTDPNNPDAVNGFTGSYAYPGGMGLQVINPL